MSSDVRLRDLIGQRVSESSNGKRSQSGLSIQKFFSHGLMVQLLGFPSDEGVRRNGGRPGAAVAPQTIADLLMNMTPVASAALPPSGHGLHQSGTASSQPGTASPQPGQGLPQPGTAPPQPGQDADPPESVLRKNHIALLERTGPLEMIDCTGDVERDQERLGTRVAELLQAGIFPIILGGGHETAYGHFLGYVMAGMDTTIVNLDAHTDVRPLKQGLAHSGSPFFQALTHPSGHCRAYHVCGLNSFSVAEEHAIFVQKMGGETHFGAPTPELLHRLVDSGTGSNAESGSDAESGMDSEAGKTGSATKVMMTLDMDVVHQADAPGVSAPNAAGIRSEQWLNLARTAAANASVTSLDLCEVNPRYDRDHQTARLAALTVWTVLLELSKRIL